MIDIDIVKAAAANPNSNANQNKHPPSCYSLVDDTDAFELDTALNTPTGSMSDSLFTRRFSSSSTTSYKNYHYYNTVSRKPSTAPRSPELYHPSPVGGHNNNNIAVVELLEKKIQVLESEIHNHIKREADLESQLLSLAQERKNENNARQYKSTISRISKHIDRFLGSHESSSIDNNALHESCVIWQDEDWCGNEILKLFETNSQQIGTTLNGSSAPISNRIDQNDGDHKIIGADDMVYGTHSFPKSSCTPIILVLRLQSMIDSYMNTQVNTKVQGHQQVSSFCAELHQVLEAWRQYSYNTTLIEQKKKDKEQDRVTRLLDALQKSLLRNKTTEKDYSALIKQYKKNMGCLLKDTESKLTKLQQQYEQGRVEVLGTEEEENFGTVKIIKEKPDDELNELCEKNTSGKIQLYETQIRTLESNLSACQEERNEYETTVEIVRREMETMLEELEDTRQQKTRYKTQASRLRAGLEAIQKKSRARNSRSNPNDNSSEEDDDSSEEDEGMESLRLLYNEAERQAIDLDRECKRQTLTLASLRKELQTTEEKHLSSKTEKSKELEQFRSLNRDLKRQIELIQLEKQSILLQLQQKSDSKGASDQPVLLPNSEPKAKVSASDLSSIGKSIDHSCEISNTVKECASAEIYALQIYLKAAKADSVIHRTRLSQLERQISHYTKLDQHVSSLQSMFKKELDLAESCNNGSSKGKDDQQLQEIARMVELEKKAWKEETFKSEQKKCELGILGVNRELRFLSGRLLDTEEETRLAHTRHLEKVSLIKYQANAETERKIQKLTSEYLQRERQLKDKLEEMFHNNQTLQNESLILYGRNMMMAQKLGKIAS